MTQPTYEQTQENIRSWNVSMALRSQELALRAVQVLHEAPQREPDTAT